VFTYAPTEPVPTEHEDADALVVWGNTRKQLSDSAARLHNLRWVAALSAGVDVIEAAGFAPEVVITNGSGLHDGPVAEHTLMLSLAAARRFDLAYGAQLEGRWAKELGWAQPVGVQRDGSTFPGLGTLADARITIWGFGSIAASLAPLYRTLGAHVTGIANSSGERHGFPVVSGAEILEVLAGTDLLVNILPSLPSTEKIISTSVFETLPNHAWLVNVGRGATVDEDALDQALRSGQIGGAALDVFACEPLPTESPLWTAPNVLITPHAAGGRPVGASEFVAKNVQRFLAGEPLINTIER
jgi:phosphoglycerate dehydrogenase-like enzyme